MSFEKIKKAFAVDIVGGLLQIISFLLNSSVLWLSWKALELPVQWELTFVRALSVCLVFSVFERMVMARGKKD